jgi:hypothetical protein
MDKESLGYQTQHVAICSGQQLLRSRHLSAIKWLSSGANHLMVETRWAGIFYLQNQHNHK